MSPTGTDDSLTLARCVVRNTAARPGRTRAVAPGATSMTHLHYGRIILSPGDAALSFSTGEHETAFIALGGLATIAAEGGTYDLHHYDALYVPRDCSVEIRPGSGGCDLAEVSAPVARRYPVQFVSFADVQKDLACTSKRADRRRNER